MDSPATPAPSLDAVASLMEACLALPEEQQSAALERACREHPEHAAELSKRIRFLQQFGLASAEVGDLALHERWGDFETLERLASGGMGVVYRARQLSLGREVALKLVRPDLVWFDGARERFRREAQAVARLEHPGIVPVFACGEDRGVPYLAMALVAGRSLAQALALVAGRAPESLRGTDLLGVEAARAPAGFERDWTRAAALVARDVARALTHAHERGVVHRDVKPSNILLRPDGVAQLIDFGLSGADDLERMTRSGSQTGTLHYMAPERLRGERGVDARCDVYSLGVTLYELLALQAPFEGATRVELEQRVLDGRPDSLRARNRRVDADLERVCFAAMAPLAHQRYASAAAFADDLTRWLDGAPVLARRPSALERGSLWVRRNKARTTALALALSLAIGVPSALWLQQRRHTRELEASLAAERLALADLKVSNELFTRVLRDASPAHAGGAQVTLYESLEKLAALARDERDSPRATARVLSMIGQIQLSRSDYAKSRELLELAEARLREQGFEHSAERVLALEKLGDVERALGEMQRARERYREAARVAEQLDAREDNWSARLAALEASTWLPGDPKAAAELLRSALASFRASANNRDDQQWLQSQRLRLAKLEGALGDPQLGLARLEEVRAAIAARGAAPSLKEQLELAAAESDLRMSAREFERARSVLEEAVSLARAELGERNSSVATLRFQLGRALFELGRLDEARGEMEAALALRRELTGADSTASQQLAEALAKYFPPSAP